MPQDNAYPTSLWLPGEFVADTYSLPALPDVERVRVGLYNPQTGVRLALNEGGSFIEFPVQ